MQRDWHPADIRAELEKRGKTLSDIAREAGFTEAATRHALRRRPWPSMKRRIAEAIGRRPHEIWPSLFDERDQVRSDRYRLKAIMRPRRRNVCSDAAA